MTLKLVRKPRDIGGLGLLAFDEACDVCLELGGHRSTVECCAQLCAGFRAARSRAEPIESLHRFVAHDSILRSEVAYEVPNSATPHSLGAFHPVTCVPTQPSCAGCLEKGLV
eukprot:CAMPEP_0206036698 /NCGR_PEP_ID=MMETSP1466-20131121/2954_1 /ASSEMBLY_ACC=CAM_ASM_001126 /TAXON_ID=44452 /ORGANISM="Pavlova gyrans, Strain CCMP608" /LENGTH=111 /DNA_ID=CAMNT_0053411195 /DNA_START=84 /DNA_END=419 /DNA_ORIENTATION=+